MSTNSCLCEDEILLRDAAQSVVKSVVESRAGENLGDWRRNWETLGEHGWPGVLLPAAEGGFGGSETDLLLLSQALGFGLLRTPFLNSVAFATPLLASASERQRQILLPGVVSGEVRLAVAHQERARDPAARRLATIALSGNDGYVLNGTKYMVLYGLDTNWLLVSARLADEVLGLFLVSPQATGVSATPYRLIDGSEAADFTFHDVKLANDARLGGHGADMRARIEEAVLIATLAAVGEALGCVEATLALSVGHLQTRKQFGVPLASFQVLRHRIADMYIAVEELRYLAFAAARIKDTSQRADAIRAAKIHLGQAGVWVSEQAVQLHGAMGVTEECKVGQYLKRVTVLDRTFGGSDHHIAKMAATLLGTEKTQ